MAELDDSLDKHQELLAKRDRELRELQHSIAFYRAEVARLSEANDSLGATNAQIQDTFKKDIANVNKKYDRKREHLIQLSKEHTDLQKQYSELQGGMEKVIRQEIQVAIQDKDAEIDKLKDELGMARALVKKLQKEALTAAADAAQQIAHAQEAGKNEVNKYLSLKPEEYFPTAWKDFTVQLYAWCAKFSKQSERTCLSLHRIADDWVRDRVEVVMLDDTGVRRILKDKTKRQDVLAAIVMRIIREAIFTRYLFGLTAEERQKLNGIERHLSESGPPAAVNLWRATTLTLLSQRPTFQDKRTAEANAVVKDIVRALSGILPQPTQLSSNLVDELRAIVAAAVQLSIEMRTQRAQYMVPAPPNPTYDNNGDNVSRVPFTVKTMTHRGPAADGSMPRDEELERERALVKLILFPLVVKIGTDSGENYDSERVVVPMTVLVTRPHEVVLLKQRDREIPPLPPMPGKLVRSTTSAVAGSIERNVSSVPGRLNRSTTSTNIERDTRNSVHRDRDKDSSTTSEPRPGRVRRSETVPIGGGTGPSPSKAPADDTRRDREREYLSREREKLKREDEGAPKTVRTNRVSTLRDDGGERYGIALSPVLEGGTPESSRRGITGGSGVGVDRRIS